MTSFQRVTVPPDCLYLKPGDEVVTTMLRTVSGEDCVAVGFMDPRAGAIRILLHPEAARAVMDASARARCSSTPRRVASESALNAAPKWPSLH